MWGKRKHDCPDHQVFLAHSGRTDDNGITYDSLVDEQYYFENPEDARWFYRDGYKGMLHQGEERPDTMNLWIDGQEVTEESQSGQ